MKTKQNSKPSHYVQLKLDEERIEREWEGIEQGLQKQRGLRLYRVAGITAIAAAVLVVVGLTFIAFNQDEVEDSAQNPQVATKTLTLPDGTQLQMDKQAEMEVASATQEAVHIAITGGRVLFDVPTIVDRKFTVGAGNALVTVTGTRFSVELTEQADESRVEVSVIEGSVKIRDLEKNETVALNSGRTWSSTFDSDTDLNDETMDTAPEEEIAMDVEPAPPTVEKQIPNPGKSTAPHTPSEVRITAGDLFKRAQQENLNGNRRLAADLFDELVTKFETDSRAPLAAFQLGRLRMDTIGDASGALKAFNKAIKLGPGYPFIEDVEARRVQALERLGRTTECAAAKEKYLSRYPNGVHRGSVERRCVD